MIFKNISGKVYLIIAAGLILSGIFTAGSSQPNIRSENETPAATEEKSTSGDNKTYEALALPDSRFSVKNINFVRRYDSGGLGEFLDVVFEIKNHTQDDLNFYIYVLAFYETDSIVRTGGNFVPYPTWRKYDPDSKNFLTHYIRISPEHVEDDKIWNKEDPDFLKYRKIHHRITNHATTLENVHDFHPPYWKYLAYINNNKRKGLPVKLFGTRSPKPEEMVSTNYIPPTPEEAKLKIHPTIVKHTYTISYNRSKTNVQTHHHSLFRPGYKFFNRAAIIIYDADRVNQTEELDAGRNPQPGEKVNEPLVYKQTIMLPRLKNF
ncbi:MAG: hypothetical protein OEZ34_11550 [Spirochaetia bacterium]|nr:hypothetical protein [Spirochaetia bacterium]